MPQLLVRRKAMVLAQPTTPGPHSQFHHWCHRHYQANGCGPRPKCDPSRGNSHMRGYVMKEEKKLPTNPPIEQLAASYLTPLWPGCYVRHVRSESTVRLC